MEVTNQFDWVGHESLAIVAEEFTDGNIVGAPKRLFCLARKIFVEEE
jgi:hypothetical protein